MEALPACSPAATPMEPPQGRTLLAEVMEALEAERRLAQRQAERLVLEAHELERLSARLPAARGEGSGWFLVVHTSWDPRSAWQP